MSLTAEYLKNKDAPTYAKNLKKGQSILKRAFDDNSKTAINELEELNKNLKEVNNDELIQLGEELQKEIIPISTLTDQTFPICKTIAAVLIQRKKLTEALKILEVQQLDREDM